MQSLHADRDEIINVVAPFPSRSISDWEEFNDVLDGYKKRNNLKFRVRSSQTTVLCNSTHDDQLPSEYRYAYKIFRCTHGVSQSSRSKGHRNRKTCYCGCSARFTAVVSPAGEDDFIIKIINENYIHSHPTTAFQASSYLTTCYRWTNKTVKV
ncbi:hypothetical protein F442_09917 [Phytophthora nicotianae P10297]|uniref:ZSWIM3 N-terminal domain-containing protein n=4 Tax=Phytophthora nicotianae TaxID=4792 RepID=V9F4Y8_PHYNI|nr:hypothetical protein F443_10015 [Phytophthora nicotianae P1569]ETL38774.1 hypothetical protein L916_09719 [Phytophthora nicotianae]ETM45193.1 hypothetical protein L914_09686 [Phytophthora nicotianae]ETO74037.1 hypothetical protein F444_10107 [Phytophthora nicotianae P1976]ETP43280.1 hypothetical protein F442_09917 [Phytophthora nicotianae P10297]